MHGSHCNSRGAFDFFADPVFGENEPALTVCIGRLIFYSLHGRIGRIPDTGLTVPDIVIDNSPCDNSDGDNNNGSGYSADDRLLPAFQGALLLQEPFFFELRLTPFLPGADTSLLP